MVRPSITLTRLVPYISSIMHVLLAVFAGYLVSALVSGQPTIDPLVFVFVAVSKLFAVAFKDDRSASKKRRMYSAVGLAMLFPLLLGLTLFEFVMGVLILALYSLQPFVDGRAPFDVVHHVLRYIVIFVFGYGSQAFFNGTGLLTIFAITSFSVAGELLAGLGRSNYGCGSAASLLGIRRSLIIVVSSIFTGSLMAALVFNSLFDFPIQIFGASFPFYIIPALAIDLFITAPLVKVLIGRSVDPFRLIRRKELIVVLVASLSILVVFQAGKVSAPVTVNSRSYSFDVGIRTFIAGPHDWDVPWIVFDYVDENNYYYVVFHKDGVLELSQMVNGETLHYVSFAETDLTPFQWHSFHILVNETTVVVTLDEVHQLSTTRRLVSDPSSVKVQILHPTVFWVACSCSLSVSS